MNTKPLATTLAGILLTLAQAIVWAGPPPNPTQSDSQGNTAGGTGVLLHNAKPNNTGFGLNALITNTEGASNTALGAYSLSLNTAGNVNTAIGTAALFANATGEANLALGAFALTNNSGGSNNTASGVSALSTNTIGRLNTAVGSEALARSVNGSNNTALGARAGINLTSGSWNIHLGHKGVAKESSTMRLGTPGVQVRTFVAGVRGVTLLTDPLPVFIGSNGQMGALTSSRRFKTDIQDMAERSRDIYKLRPVVYRYQGAAPARDDSREYGLIAEEVAGVYPDLVARSEDGQIEAVQYHKLIPMLLNEVQHLNKELAASQSKVHELDALRQEVSQLRAQNQRLEVLMTQWLESQGSATPKPVALRP